MGAIRSFRDLDVWQTAMELVLDCYALTRSYPPSERYTLARETHRSAISIPSNIAEGHNRHTRNAYLNHVNIALGSQAELETQVEIAIRLGYVSRAGASDTIERIGGVGRILHGLQRSLQALARPVQPPAPSA